MYTEKTYYKDVDHDMLGETEEDSKVHKGSSPESFSSRFVVKSRSTY